MPYKDKSLQLACQRAHYKRNRKQRMVLNKTRMFETASLIRKLKDNQPCVDCGDRYPYYVMDFDHLHSKKLNPSYIPKMGWCMERIQEELDKCELVCSNCHRERTHKRTMGLKL